MFGRPTAPTAVILFSLATQVPVALIQNYIGTLRIWWLGTRAVLEKVLAPYLEVTAYLPTVIVPF